MEDEGMSSNRIHPNSCPLDSSCSQLCLHLHVMINSLLVNFWFLLCTVYLTCMKRALWTSY